MIVEATPAIPGTTVSFSVSPSASAFYRGPDPPGAIRQLPQAEGSKRADVHGRRPESALAHDRGDPAETDVEVNRLAAGDHSLTSPAGSFDRVVQIDTDGTTDPDLRERTWWAPGAGLIGVDEELSVAGTDRKVTARLSRWRPDPVRPASPQAGRGPGQQR